MLKELASYFLGLKKHQYKQNDLVEYQNKIHIIKNTTKTSLVITQYDNPSSQHEIWCWLVEPKHPEFSHGTPLSHLIKKCYLKLYDPNRTQLECLQIGYNVDSGYISDLYRKIQNGDA